MTGRVLILRIAMAASLTFSAAPVRAGEEAARPPGSVETLEQIWQTRLGKGVPNRYGSVEIVGEALYATNTAGEVHKLELRTGKVIFKVKLPERIQDGLAATSDGLYVSTAEGVFRLDPVDGEVRWGTDIGEAVSNVPAVNGDEVLAGTINQGKVALLRAGDGTILWRRQLGWSITSCCLAGPHALVCTRNRTVYGLFVLDRKTGETVWEYACRGSNAAIGEGLVYFGDAALRLRDGSVVWTLPDAARHWAAGPDVVVGVFGRHRIAAFHPATGERLWGRAVPGRIETGWIPLRSGLALVGDKVVAAAERGDVIVLDARTGELLGTTRLSLKSYDDNGQIHGPPAVADGVIVVASSGCKTVALALPETAGSWCGENGGGARWGRAAEAGREKLLRVPAPEPLEGEKEKEALARAAAVEEENERADALAAVVRRYAGSDVGREAFELLFPLYQRRLTELTLRNMPEGDWDLAFPDLEVEVKDFAMVPDHPVVADAFERLRPPAIADALGSGFVGRRAWACERLAELGTPAARRIVLWLAARDDSDLVRGSAVESLGAFAKEKTARDALLRAFRDPSDVVRRAACTTAPEVLGAAAREILRRVAASDPDDIVRQVATKTLQELDLGDD